MAVIKANYVRRDRKAKARAKATIRYIQSRPGKDGEKLTRQLFGQDGALTLAQALNLIDQAKKGTVFYRLVLSPDPKAEDNLKDIDLREITLQLIQRLEERLKTKILFAASEHSDHSPNRHVHIMALLSRKLSKQDFLFLRQAAAEVILQQKQIRQLANGQAPDRITIKEQTTQLIPAGRQTTAGGVHHKRTHTSAGASSVPAPPPPVHICPGCGESGELAIHRLAQYLYRCGSCGAIYKDIGMQTQIERSTPGLGLETSLS
jgi:ribosomal protein L37AE/L43A